MGKRHRNSVARDFSFQSFSFSHLLLTAYGTISTKEAEEILNALAHIRGLKVVGRSSSFFYKSRSKESARAG
jgi:hypothetical protein